MSQIRQIVRKLRAFEAQRALPKFSTIHTFLPENPAILAFVRMSGETRPWGIAFGRLEDGPQIYAVEDGRNRESIQEMLENFAIDFINFFRVENFTFEPISKENLQLEDPPQIWLPNSSHVDMLHFINYMYWRTRADDSMETYRTTLSRLCGWLFRESTYTGQQLIVDASAVLRENYIFPVDDVTIANTATALAWLNPRGSINEKLHEARKWSQDAVGITMQPDVEIKLEKHLKPGREEAFDINLIITAELERRWSTAADSYRQLKSDQREVNPGAIELMKDSLHRYVFGFQYGERKRADEISGQVFTPHPETDNHGSAAAAGYYDLQRAESKFLPSLIHHDEELLKDSIFSGHAISGHIVRVFTEATGPRSKDIFWVLRVEARDDFRVREGEQLAPMGDNGHSVKVIALEYVDETQIDLTLQWKGKKTMALKDGAGPKPESDSWIAEIVYFVPFNSSEFDKMAMDRVWKARSGRGAWLTHGEAVVSPDQHVIDDVKQIESDN